MTAEEFYSGLYPTNRTAYVLNGVQISPDLNFLFYFSEAYKQNELQYVTKLLNDLCDLQNGPPLATTEKQYNEVMEKVYEYLSKSNNS